jgi:hypothetical protein
LITAGRKDIAWHGVVYEKDCAAMGMSHCMDDITIGLFEGMQAIDED